MSSSIDQFKLSPLTLAIRKETQHGGSIGRLFKKIAPIAISFALPHLAPALATSMGITSFVGRVAVAATLGGATSKILGGDFLTGAIAGGLGQATQGLLQNAGTNATNISGPVSPASNVVQTSRGLIARPQPSLLFQTAPAGSQTAGLLSQGANIGANTANTVSDQIRNVGNANLTDRRAFTNFQTDVAAQNALRRGTVPTNLTAQDRFIKSQGGNVSTDIPIDQNISPVTTGQTGSGQTLTENIANRGAAIVKPIKDAMVAKLKANPELISQTLSPFISDIIVGDDISSFSPEEQRAINERRAELKRIGAQNESLLNDIISESRFALQEAKNIDPHGKGLQAANEQLLRGEKQADILARRSGLFGTDLDSALRKQGTATDLSRAHVFNVAKGQEEVRREGFLNKARAGLKDAKRTPSGTASEAALSLEEDIEKTRAAKKDAAATNITTIFDSFVGNTGKTQEETDRERDERDQQIFSTAFNLGQNNATT